MAQNAAKIFSGPITTLELSANGSTYTDIGFGTAECTITWEPSAQELSDSNMVQLSGIGKISLELVQTDSTTLTAVQAYKQAKAYVRITTADSQTYVVSGIFLSTQVTRGFKPGESHKMVVTGQRSTVDADDWVTFPA
jgi:hypothetical protein